MLKQKASSHLLFVVSLCLYLFIGYGVERHETGLLFFCFFTLFALYGIAVSRHKNIAEEQLRYWLAASAVFRIALLFATPALSDDFYRFIWDGRILAAGLDPFSAVPADYLTHMPPVAGLDHALYEKLNNTGTYTIYPPVPQLIFWLSAIASPHSIAGSVIVMKMIAVAFELATIWIIIKLLGQYRLPRGTALLYALNPLVILELSGNLHHEGIAIFFLFAAIYLLGRDKLIGSGMAYALAISTKLIPLLFLPLLIRHLGWKKTALYWTVTASFTVVCFVPLLSNDLVEGMSTSLGYYFQWFEFNASLYYIVRELGYLVAGFNIIQYAGPVLGGLAFVSVWFIALYQLPRPAPGILKRRLFTDMLWCLFIYFLAATILHPWYIITLFAISLFTPFRFPLVWTGVIFLTYAGYHHGGFAENLLLVAVEYAVVACYFLYEALWKNRAAHV